MVIKRIKLRRMKEDLENARRNVIISERIYLSKRKKYFKWKTSA